MMKKIAFIARAGRGAADELIFRVTAATDH